MHDRFQLGMAWAWWTLSEFLAYPNCNSSKFALDQRVRIIKVGLYFWLWDTVLHNIMYDNVHNNNIIMFINLSDCARCTVVILCVRECVYVSVTKLLPS